MKPIRVAILTLSDRSAHGDRPDLSGAALKGIAVNLAWEVVSQLVLPDDLDQISHQLRSWADAGQVDLILTTGGTGFTDRDVTPEATNRVIERPVPGLAELMRLEGYKITPHAMLSRSITGIRRKTLIVNLPGSPKGAVENLGFILDLLPHAVEQLRGESTIETGHKFHLE